MLQRAKDKPRVVFDWNCGAERLNWGSMSFDHSSHRMIFRTRLTGRWAQVGGLMPLRHHHHRLTTRQQDAEFLLKMILWTLLLIFVYG
jgi:hypothetical protein